MSDKLFPSKFKKGEKVVLTKEVAGFPEGHIFIVEDHYKAPGKVGGRYYDYTIKVIDIDERQQGDTPPTIYTLPGKYLKKLKK